MLVHAHLIEVRGDGLVYQKHLFSDMQLLRWKQAMSLIGFTMIYKGLVEVYLEG